MAIVPVEDAAPLILKPSVSGGTILLKVYDQVNARDENVPSGDSARDDVKPSTGAPKVEVRIKDDGATAFTVTNVGGSAWTRPPGVAYCCMELSIPPSEGDENTCLVTIAASGATTRTQTIIIRHRPF